MTGTSFRVFASSIAVGLTGFLAACAEQPVDAPADDAAEAVREPLSAETRVGPVSATVTLSPPRPRLGDAMTLTLAVAAAPGVTFELPAFGDALGRFAIVDYAPREDATPDGGTEASQRYTLQAAASGRQRIPSLRVEFVDEREGAANAKPRELLTDELGFEVESVLPEGEVASELRPARAFLAELQGPWWARHWPWFVVAGLVAAAAAGGVAIWLRRAEQRARSTAFERAMARLGRLQGKGLPDADELDAWYVELSDIVRRYIEARFALRAPELTTEEFLLEAGRSADLTPSHRDLLSAFLERCDRVKFARYSPGESESHQALGLARQFLLETRDTAEHDASSAAESAPVPPRSASAQAKAAAA